MRLLQRALIGLLSLSLIALSLAVSGYLGRGAEWLQVPLGPTEHPAPLEAFQDGYRAERAGNLDEALAKYRVAAKSPLPAVQGAAQRAVDRVTGKLNFLGTRYRYLQILADWPLWIGLLLLVPFAFSDLLSLLSFAARVGRRRRGTEIRRFSVVPESAPNLSIQFDRVLLGEIARIAHAYQSDQLRRIGATVAFSYTADSELAGLESRAISAIRQGEIKSVIGFALAELYLRWQNMGFRPEYELAGTVIIGPAEATVRAQLLDFGRGGILSILEASSREISFATGLILPLSAATTAPTTVLLEADRREDAQRLSDLATVLACKFSVRWMEKLPPDIRPSSWQTVYNMVRGLSALEAAS